MTAADTARAMAEPVYDVGGRFMLDGATFARGAELGLPGMVFYFVGRAGVLGAVDADRVTEELGVFAPDTVREHWDAGVAVMDPTAAAAEFMACGHTWGREHLPDGLDAGRLVQLMRRLVEVTERPDAQVPAMFAARRAVPWPDDERAAALHGIHLLRELRGGLHARAVRDARVAPHDAVVVRQGEGMAALFGWPEPHPDPEAARAAWEVAEEATNAAAAAFVAQLGDVEQDELVELLRAAV